MVEVYPKRNWLTVRRVPLGQTNGGILLPDSDGAVKYVVERVSEDVEMGVKPGQEILTVSQGAVPAEIVGGDPDLFLIQESSIAAIVERQDA